MFSRFEKPPNRCVLGNNYLATIVPMATVRAFHLVWRIFIGSRHPSQCFCMTLWAFGGRIIRHIAE